MRRRRTISFRLDDREFEALRKRSSQAGARTVSEFARAVLSRSATPRFSRTILQSDLCELSSRMTEFRDQVERLLRVLEPVPMKPKQPDHDEGPPE